MRSAASAAAGGRPRTPSSRCTTWSAQARSAARSEAGTPSSSLITSIGSLPAKSAMKSQRVCSRQASRCSRAIARIRGSSSDTRRGVKPRETSARMRVCRGGSIARNDMVASASGWKTS